MLKRLYGKSAGAARMLNLVLLIAGYGFGQGSIFLAQTWLVAKGDLTTLASFGTHFSFAMLGILLVDAGGLVALARHASLAPEAESGRAGFEHTMWRKFWEVSVFRAFLAAMVIGGIAIAGIAGFMDDFSFHYALWAAPAFLIWSINAAGFLDGLKLSGISGVSGSIAFIASAVGLLLIGGSSASVAGTILGVAFTAGYLLTVVVQFAALRVAGWPLRFERPGWAGIAASARDGVALLGNTLPGQLNFRIQLLISSTWLGMGPTALLVYVKQIIAAAAQLIGFIRRIEFPALVQQLAGDVQRPLAVVAKAQRLGTLLALVMTAGIMVCGLVLTRIDHSASVDVGWYLALFSVTVATSAVLLGLGQGVAAMGRYNALFVCSSISTAAGLLVGLALVQEAGLSGLFAGEIVAAILGILLFASVLGKKTPK
ncbi:hypothetical protein H0274_11200 [Altererythrobacter sp. CC-YST694]|uniref:hypothetical protein n=1 Tax=Altererythrobacter sp. CC-YST694 TaxID=2755038 RepID=UPI001D02D175|nr:hypothetical protein [Altererythrobacter sp. CC-YST694]MCB5425828.1 hypothetical protein [Altererythrobacter sp. CC-YST694]